MILNFLGELALSEGDQQTARANFEESLAIRRELGDRWGIPQLLGNLASIARAQGDLTKARRVYAEALVGFEELKS